MAAGGYIAQYRRSCGESAGAASEHELFVVAFAFDNHAVEFVFHAVDIFIGRYETRQYAQSDLVVGDLRYVGQQFDACTLFAGVSDVGFAEVGYAVVNHVVGVHVCAECVYGYDYQLEQRVEAIHVERGVAFGEA